MPDSRLADLVSVVVPNYNKADYIAECLDSISRQTYDRWELIVVDDGSADPSPTRIAQWLERRERPEAHSVTFVALPRNVGYAGALTTGYFLARGEYIAVQDSDDLSHPDRLLKQVECLKANPALDLVGTNYAAFEADPAGAVRFTEAKWLKYGERIVQTYHEGGHCVCHGTIMFRGRLFDEVGGLSRRIAGAEDYEFIAKCLAHRARIENLPDILYYYRLHREQRSRVYYARKGGG